MAELRQPGLHRLPGHLETGGNLCQRLQHKGPLGHARVRQGAKGRLQPQGIKQQQVDIDAARPVTHGRIRAANPPKARLQGQHLPQQGFWSVTGFKPKLDNLISEPGLSGIILRFCQINGRGAHKAHPFQCGQSLAGQSQIGLGIAKVGAEAHKGKMSGLCRHTAILPQAPGQNKPLARSRQER